MSFVYIAGPWFTDEQLEIIEKIKEVLDRQGVDYFSPKDSNLFEPGDDPKDILNGNLEAVYEAQFVVAVTDGKDVGTMFEAGYAYAHAIPILYLWLGYQPGMKFNIMLAASGQAVHTYEQLESQIKMFKEHGVFATIVDKGMEYE